MGGAPELIDVPVVFCFDKAYAPYTAVASWSLARNGQNLPPVYWVVRAADRDMAGQWRSRISAPGLFIEIVAVDDGVFSGWHESFHITRAAYMRLLLPKVIPARRALYLDGDLLVLAPVEHLLGLDMGTAILAGVVNKAPSGKLSSNPLCSDAYLNSGVLLMNLERMREENFLEHCLAVQSRHGAGFTWHDQDILNKAADGRKLVLPERWNHQVWAQQISAGEWQALMSSGAASIVHFLGPVKPWQGWCNPAVAQGWKRYADGIRLEAAYYPQISTLRQALSLAGVLDRNGSHAQASTLKGRIIRALLDQRGVSGKAPDIDSNLPPPAG